jgi:hypothetical protein
MSQEQRWKTVGRDAATREQRDRTERLERQVQRARAAEMRDVAVEVLGIDRDDVARALRGVLTESDER